MTKIVINPILNRFTLTLSGSFDLEDALHTIREIEHEVTGMKPGFDVITDLRFLKRLNMQAAMKIKKGTKILEKRGAKRVVRIVGGSQLAVKVFGKFSSLFGSKTEVYYVPTLEDAEKILEKSQYAEMV